LVRAVGSSVVTTLLGQLLNLLLLPFILDQVGVQLYGTWAAVATILSVGALVDAGIRTEIVRRVGQANGAQRPDEAMKAVHDGTGVLLKLVVPLVAAGVCLAPLIRAAVFDAAVPGLTGAELDWALRAAFLLVGASVMLRAHFSVLAGFQRIDLEIFGYAVGLPVGSVATLIGAYRGLGLWAFFLGAALGLAAESVTHLVLVRGLLPEFRFRPTRSRAVVVRSFLTLSGLALLTQVSDIVDSQWDKLVVTRIVGPAAVANFHLGTTLVRQARAFVLLPLAPLLVAVAEREGGRRGETDRLVSLMSRATLALASVLLPLAVILANPFIELWLGDGYGVAAQSAQLFCVAAYIGVLSAPLAYVVLGLRMHRLAARSAVTNIVVNGVASLVLTLHFGVPGALYGSIAGATCGSLVLARSFSRIPDRPRHLVPWRSMLLALSCAALALLGDYGRLAKTWPALVGCALAYTVVVGAACVAVERLSVRELLRQARAGHSPATVMAEEPSVDGGAPQQ
jgi:O-antigen/teichoic acid export membrane protein